MKSAPLLLTLFSLVLSSAASSPALADELTYSASFDASGTLNGLAFTNRQISIDGTTNSSGRYYFNSDIGIDAINAPLIGTISGLGSFSFLTQGDFFTNAYSPGVGGVSAVDTHGNLADIVDIQNMLFTFIDPLYYGTPFPYRRYYGGTPTVQRNEGFATSDGVLILTSASGSGNFDGVLAPTPVTPSAVSPEPGTFLLLGTGLLGVAGVMKRRFV